MKTWIPDARNFAYLTWKQVDALPREQTLLVLPTAAIEQHGHHDRGEQPRHRRAAGGDADRGARPRRAEAGLP